MIYPITFNHKGKDYEITKSGGSVTFKDLTDNKYFSVANYSNNFIEQKALIGFVVGDLDTGTKEPVTAKPIKSVLADDDYSIFSSQVLIGEETRAEKIIDQYLYDTYRFAVIATNIVVAAPYAVIENEFVEPLVLSISASVNPTGPTETDGSITLNVDEGKAGEVIEVSVDDFVTVFEGVGSVVITSLGEGDYIVSARYKNRETVPGFPLRSFYPQSISLIADVE